MIIDNIDWFEFVANYHKSNGGVFGAYVSNLFLYKTSHTKKHLDFRFGYTLNNSIMESRELLSKLRAELEKTGDGHKTIAVSVGRKNEDYGDDILITPSLANRMFGGMEIV